MRIKKAQIPDKSTLIIRSYNLEEQGTQTVYKLKKTIEEVIGGTNRNQWRPARGSLNATATLSDGSEVSGAIMRNFMGFDSSLIKGSNIIQKDEHIELKDGYNSSISIKLSELNRITLMINPYENEKENLLKAINSIGDHNSFN